MIARAGSAAAGAVRSPSWPRRVGARARRADRVQDRVQVQPTRPVSRRRRAQTALAIDDPLAVFGFVLGQLPERVQVIRPRIISISGSRIAACPTPAISGSRPPTATRARSISPTASSRPTGIRIRRHITSCWAAEQGVTVEKAGAAHLSGDACAAKSVTFVLNDLSKVKPPAGTDKARRDVPRAGLRRVRRSAFSWCSTRG